MRCYSITILTLTLVLSLLATEAYAQEANGVNDAEFATIDMAISLGGNHLISAIPLTEGEEMSGMEVYRALRRAGVNLQRKSFRASGFGYYFPVIVPVKSIPKLYWILYETDAHNGVKAGIFVWEKTDVPVSSIYTFFTHNGRRHRYPAWTDPERSNGNIGFPFGDIDDSLELEILPVAHLQDTGNYSARVLWPLSWYLWLEYEFSWQIRQPFFFYRLGICETERGDFDAEIGITPYIPLASTSEGIAYLYLDNLSYRKGKVEWRDRYGLTTFGLSRQEYEELAGTVTEATMTIGHHKAEGHIYWPDATWTCPQKETEGKG